MAEGKVELAREGRVATITFDRPPVNVFDIQGIGDLRRTIEDVCREGKTDVLVLKTAGEKVFSAGVEVKDHTPEKVPGMLEGFDGLCRVFLEIEPVSIAVVQGPALGGGAEMALSCDLVVAAEESRFSFPEIELACFPPVALATLPLRVGPQRAAEMVLTGAPVSAEEARAMGLVNRVVPRAALSEATAELVGNLTQKSPEVLRMTARYLRKMVAEEYTRRIQQAEEAYLKELIATDDMKEGIQAFLEKRKPRWRTPG